MMAEPEMLGLLEPSAEEIMIAIRKVVEGGHKVPHEQMAQPLLMSIAVSLKRIADELDRGGPRHTIADSLYGIMRNGRQS